MDKDNDLLQKLIQERDKLLKNNPELIAFQLEVDELLKHIEDPLEKCHKQFELLMQKMNVELLPSILELKKITPRINKTYELVLAEKKEEKKAS